MQIPPKAPRATNNRRGKKNRTPVICSSVHKTSAHRATVQFNVPMSIPTVSPDSFLYNGGTAATTVSAISGVQFGVTWPNGTTLSTTGNVQIDPSTNIQGLNGVQVTPVTVRVS